MRDRRHDQKGKSTGQYVRSVNKHAKIDGPFAPRLIEMLECPAMRVLSLTARRILDRLEIEFAHHGGSENGKLPCTYADLERFGINRRQIGAGFAELVSLGFLEIARPGRAGNAEYRAPTLYRLTYRHMDAQAPTHEWRRVRTIEEAEAIVKQSREPLAEFERRRRAKKDPRKKQKAGVGFAENSVVETHTESRVVPGVETHTTVPVGETHTTIDISGGREADTGAAAVSTAVLESLLSNAARGPHDSQRGSAPADAVDLAAVLAARMKRRKA